MSTKTVYFSTLKMIVALESSTFTSHMVRLRNTCVCSNISQFSQAFKQQQARILKLKIETVSNANPFVSFHFSSQITSVEPQLKTVIHIVLEYAVLKQPGLGLKIRPFPHS